MGKTSKIAISLPAELLEAVEAECRDTQQTRSEVFRRAVRLLLRKRLEAIWDRQYIEAYRKCPDTPEEIEAAGRAASIFLAAVPWEE